jgi:hypothetical protein
MTTPYDPQVNDYVHWKSEYKDHMGWVYFKDEEYITIELGVKDKPHCVYSKNSLHCKEHLLLVCHKFFWNELTYIKSRKSVYDEQEV